MNKRGVTLIEALITLIIAGIAMFGLAAPFIAERAFWGSGKAQAESQRDAEMALRAIARVARESDTCEPLPFFGPDSIQLEFNGPAGGRCFEGGPGFGDQFRIGESCTGGAGIGGLDTLIDGNRSKVVSFQAVEIVDDRLVRIRLEVTHEAIVGSGRQENEVLETEVFLRNGS